MRGALLVLCLLLHGCTATSVSDAYVLDKSSGKGLVIMSMSQVNPPRTKLPPLVVNYRDRGSAINLDHGLFTHRGGIPIAGDDLTRLHVFELDPGQYEFYKLWWLGSNGWQPASSSGEPLAARFKVEAGKAVYLGMLQFRAHSLDSYSARVSDERERDLKLVASQWPLVARDGIEVRLFERAAKPE